MADGVLILVGTPLGNRQDFSPRAREALLTADLLLCEDTRSPNRLVGDATLPRRVSCFVGNERERIGLLLEHLEAGERVVYLSEAGLPIWSDPGRLLVRAAVDRGHAVDVIPGPTAVAVAVCHAGFEATEVRFLGFLPRGGAARRARLESLVAEPAQVVIYEAGNRVPALLRDLAGVLVDADVRAVVLARELTKLHQEVLRGTVADLAAEVATTVRGEVTVVLDGARPRLEESTGRGDARQVFELLTERDLRPRERAKQIAELTGLDVRWVYGKLSGRESADDA